MEKKTPLALWLLGFVLLSLYVVLVPRFFDAGNVPVWFAYWAGFFVVAFLISRFVLQLQGLRSLGMERHKGWLPNLAVGFLIGFCVYALKYLAFYELGKFEVAGLMEPSFILPMLGQALLAMFFSSILNDITIRGYWFAFFRRRQLLAWYVFVATVLYALDDGWNGGFDPLNMVFSALLGVSFAYTVLKTGAIWMSLGLHWGGNVMYRVMYGFGGTGVWQLENVQEGPLYDYVGLAITALMLPAVYFVLAGRASSAPVQELRTEEERAI
ncbi:CPBP family intramembrane glutamic endopeptidase [Pontibacter litorisediminis]|uniref:CPBP family intramembrane glutamic endopeptidase n=1 Tax=Pontibacter litorisediminis TaxID=1846260 RepID=UPI0023EB605E|nr:CPBP family intramembrane glutamic endopeptidase [Pontibacter litorisediminis]